MLRNLTSELYQRHGWQPKADVYRCAKGLLIKLELAGVAEQDIRITVQTDAVIIEGKRRDWRVPDMQESLSMEITYDWFHRTIPLPAPIASHEVRSEYRDGMLLIHLRC
jgi:HSP20 family protein